jgi:hydrogenase large subunit
MGLIAGKWPHSLAFRPGGLTRAIDLGEQMRLLTLLAAFRDFLEKTLFAAPLEAVIALETGDALENFAEGQGAAGDFAAFLRVAREVRLDQLGRGPGAADVERRLSWTERPPISQRSL